MWYQPSRSSYFFTSESWIQYYLFHYSFKLRVYVLHKTTFSFFKPLARRIFPYLSNMVSDSRLWKIIQGSQSETAKWVFLMHNNSLYIIVESLNVSCIKLSIKVLNTTEEAVVSQSKQPFLKCPFVSANKFHFYPASSTSIMSNRS